MSDDQYYDHRQPDISTAALLLDLRADVKVLLERSRVQLHATQDHEQRIRKLERFRFSWPSAALLGAIASVTLAAAAIFHF